MHSPGLSQKHIKQRDYKLSLQRQSVKQTGEVARLLSASTQSGIQTPEGGPSLPNA